MRFPKHEYVRSKKLLQLVANLPCQLCGQEQYVQAAHCNWGGGKGKAIKADDNLVAALCMWCHHDIDQGSQWTKRERQQAWIAAHMKTVEALKNLGQWPLDIPIPSEEKLVGLLSGCPLEGD
jgi:hypothetical protein